MRNRFPASTAIAGLLACVFSVLFINASFASAKETSVTKEKVIIFHSLTCHACIKIIHEFIPQVEKRFGGRINIDYREIGEMENYQFLLGLQEHYNISLQNKLPVVFFKGHFLTGEREIKTNLIGLIQAELEKSQLKENVAPADLFSRILKKIFWR